MGKEPGREHELGSGRGRSLGGDSSIGAWVWHGTGTRDGARSWTGQDPGSGRVPRQGHGMEPWMREEPGRYRSLGGEMSRGQEPESGRGQLDRGLGWAGL